MNYLLFTLSLLALLSCKDNKRQETVTETNVFEQPIEAMNEHQNEETSSVYDNTWTEEIVMNNGIKWEADAKTNEGVRNMQNTIKTQTTNTLDDYHKLAIQLNNDKNYVIKNCTMKGPSHDNLHVWLLPLMAKIEALSESKTIDDAVKIKHSINENISAYKTYFQ